MAAGYNILLSLIWMVMLNPFKKAEIQASVEQHRSAPSFVLSFNEDKDLIIPCDGIIV